MACYSPSYFISLINIAKPLCTLLSNCTVTVNKTCYCPCSLLYLCFYLHNLSVKREKISNETQRQALLQHSRDLKRYYRANMSDEQLHKQCEVDSQYHQHIRNQETEEQREARQQQDREHHRQMRLHEAKEQREAR